MPFRRPIVLATLACAAAGLLAGSSLAYVCHPGVAGTKMLTLRGSVVSLHSTPARASFVVKTAQGSCLRTVWTIATGTSLSSPASCPAPLRKPASTGLVPHLGVPLPARPETIFELGGIAVFAARGQGVFAMRLSDGLFGFLGPNGGAFAPQLTARGVLFHDGESKLALRQGRTVVEYVSRAAILRTIARTAHRSSRAARSGRSRWTAREWRSQSATPPAAATASSTGTSRGSRPSA